MTNDDLRSPEDLRSLGELLREAREARAYSLEEVEAQTRIRVKYLQALEQGDYSILPSVTHAKGFLRNYAQFLHLDSNAIVAWFGDLTGERTTPVTTATTPPRPQPPLPSSPQAAPGASLPPESAPADSPSPYEAAPTTAPQQPPSPYPNRHASYVTPSQRVGPSTPAGLSGTANPTPGPISRPQFAPQPIKSEPSQRAAGPVRIWQSNIFTAAVLLIGFAVIIWWTSSQLSTVFVEDIMPTEQGSRVLAEMAASATTEATPTFRPTSTEAPFAGPQILDRVLLTITVEQRSWTRIVVDGATAFEGLVEAGTILQYEGQNSILLLTGNAAALNVTYNGQQIGLLGERGEVVERIFTTGGFYTPTPTPTLTTTPTSVPTPTPRTSGTATPTSRSPGAGSVEP